MKITKAKAILWLCLLTGTAFAGWKYYSTKNAIVVDPNDVVTVSTGSIQNALDMVASVSLVNKENLLFREVGRIASVDVVEGQKVKAGQVLAKLDMSDLDHDIKAQQITLDNANAALAKLYQNYDDTAKLKAKTTLEESKRKLQSLQLDIESLQRQKDNDLLSQNSQIAEATQNLDVLQKKLDSAKLDMQYTQQTESETIAGNLASGDARVRTAKNDATSLSDGAKDAIATYKKILYIDDQSNPLLLQVGDAQTRTEALFDYNDIIAGQANLEAAVNAFNVATQDASGAIALISQAQAFAQKLTAFNLLMKDVVQKSTTSIQLSQTTLDAYASSVSGYSSKFTGSSNSLSADLKDLQSSTSISTIQLSTQSALAAKQSSLAATELEVLKQKDSLAQLQSGLKKMELDYDGKIRADQISIDSTNAAIAVNDQDYQNVLAGPKNTDIEQAQNQIRQAQLAISKLEDQRQNYELISTMDGVVSAVSIIKGKMSNSFAASNATSDGITVENRDTIQLKALLDQSQITRIKVGMPAKITFDAYKRRPFDAKVQFIQAIPSTTSGVVSYTVEFVMQKPEGIDLYDAMTASARVITDEVNDAVIIPLSAIQNGRTVQVYDGKNLSSRTVRIGKTDSSDAQIVDGLSVGERIVIRPYTGTTQTTSTGGFNLRGVTGGVRGGGGGGGGNFRWGGGGNGGGQ